VVVTPNTGDRRAVATTYILGDRDSLDGDQNRAGEHYDRGPWELQEWDGVAWQTVA
jgi:hypothetical protein